MSIRVLPAPILRAGFSVLPLASAIGKRLDNRGFADALLTCQFPIPDRLLLPLGSVAPSPAAPAPPGRSVEAIRRVLRDGEPIQEATIRPELRDAVPA